MSGDRVLQLFQSTKAYGQKIRLGLTKVQRNIITPSTTCTRRTTNVRFETMLSIITPFLGIDCAVVPSIPLPITTKLCK
ncbi:hypothetical protein CSQ93_22965 [Janthinobacterium sp. BJB426]|nr:hypothetical protein CSQ93_22965 [Janthinobacterium sp. BJB426]